MFTIARKGHMTEMQVDSRYLNETMVLKIYKPEAFSHLYKYNICIMQDGNDYYQIGRIATLSDKLHSNAEIQNTIFVGIHYQNKYDRIKKYHPSGEQQQAYSKFLAHEVSPLLDDTFPTLHMGQSRILMGDSLAGTLALMTSLNYPHTFGKVIMQSPYIDQTVLDMVENAPDIIPIEIYHTIGTEEMAVPTTSEKSVDFVTPNRTLSALLFDKSVGYRYNELDAGKHTWKYWQSDLPRALRTMLNEPF